MQKHFSFKQSSSFADAIIFFLIVTLIYSLTAFGEEWKASYNPTYEISLSLTALPLYAVFSALRGLIAYIFSLFFTLIVGFWAAKSPRAERFILPLLDIMQSIPVLGFLPGLVLSLVALFPSTNVGLELAAILMIFTGQVWNMTFAFYSSLKSVPTDWKEAASVMNLSARERLKFLELPFSAMNLTWNSMMSMAGGWFFLTVCEAFTLGNQPYRLPGLGAYMAVAIERANTPAIISGIVAMSLVIIFFDAILWRPALVWAHRYRLEETQDQLVEEPVIKLLLRESVVVRTVRFFRHQRILNRTQNFELKDRFKTFPLPNPRHVSPRAQQLSSFAAYLALGIFFAFAFARLGNLLLGVTFGTWLGILRDTGLTFVRVFLAVIIGTLWATPVGIWVTQSPKRLKVAQPIIQFFASFPAPMLYPLAVAVFLFLHINFEISAMLLMLLGAQWYILFNVLAGALRIPVELRYAMDLMGSPRKDLWRYLLLPSVFPSLVTGWVTAAGGAWNASIVSEIIVHKGQTFTAHGLGAQISQAAEHGDFAKLAACLVVMVLTVVFLNRTFWAKTFKIAQTRFRLDL